MNIGVTLTEDQLIRSWLFADNGSLIYKLSKISNIIIFCTSDSLPILSDFIRNSRLKNSNIECRPIPKAPDGKIYQFFGFLFRWTNKSSALTRKCNMMFEKNLISKKGLKTRLLMINFISRFKIIILASRWFYKYLPNLEYKSILKTYNLDILLATSITNIQDIEILKESIKLHIYTLGTTRSWDNLTSHGTLRVIPNRFLAHSEFMKLCAKNYQHLDSEIITLSGTSAYQKTFLPSANLINYPQPRIAIGCAGPLVNPSEFEFIAEFISVCNSIDPFIEVTVIQHPKFLHTKPFTELNYFQEIFKYSDYESLKEYYRKLSSYDLVLTSASTIGLDALFVGTPVEIFFIDIIKTGYWQSASRYNTHMPHFMEFISNLELKVHFDFKSLVESILKLRANRIELKSHPAYFTGFPNLDFESCVYNEINGYLLRNYLIKT